MLTSGVQLRGYRLVCLAVVALATSPFGLAAARADVITQTQTVPKTATDFTTNPPGAGPASPVFNQFNPALGTLISVTYSFTGNVQTSFNVTNQGSDTETVGGTVSKAFLSSDGPLLTLTLADGSLLNTNIAPITESESLASGGNFMKTDNESDTETQTFSSGSELALVTGTGIFTLPVSTQTFFTSIGGGNFSGTVMTEDSASITVTYTFAPSGSPTTVPEPTSLALFGLCGLGLAIVRRFRKASAT